MLVVGLLTPLAAAAVVATMTVAIGSIHKFNGFFIFRPGEGWEYTNVLAWVSFAIAWMGPGAYSFDHILVMDWTGVLGFLIGVGGFLAGIAHLGIFWRRTPQSERS
jgi:putative oxidoreductase